MTQKLVLPAILAVLTVLLTATTSAAQALPFTKHVVTQEDYARAIEKCDQRVLNVKDCNKLVDAANAEFRDEFGDNPIRNTRDLASFIRRTEVHPCPTVGRTGLARILANGAIDLKGFRRELRPGEDCLYDNQGAVWFASLSCGNFLTDRLPLTFTARRDEEFVPESSRTPLSDTVARTVFPEQQTTVSLSSRESHGISKWVAIPLGVGIAALVGYAGYRCFKTNGFCRSNEQDVTTVVQIGPGPFPGISVKQ